jgi:septal ring factor EnvC (AmiA/AmiB activator)
MIILRRAYKRVPLKTITRIAILLFVSIGIFNLMDQKATQFSKVEAYESECPEDMSLEACLEFLKEQASNIQNELGDIDGKITDEEYKQLDISQQIAYTNGLINSTQSKIDLLENAIEQNNVEVNILGDEIQVIEDNIHTASQEITKLENAIQKRVGISYKYGGFSPIEMLMNSSELDLITRQIQYLKRTKERDRELLGNMSDQIKTLEKDKEILADKKLEVQNKKEENEEKKTEIFAERVVLDQQRGQQSALLAESKKRQAEYEANLSELENIQHSVTAQITQVIFRLYEQGQIQANTPVNAGDIIGLQGNTGLSTGSHLHFEYRINGVLQNPNAIGCLSVSQGSMAGAGSCVVPVDSGYVSGYPHTYTPSLWHAVDFVSLYNGSQPGTYIWGNAVTCRSLPFSLPAGWRSTRGEGAFVRAAKAGKVTAVQSDDCGGKYVIVDHGGGHTSLYLHLK